MTLTRNFISVVSTYVCMYAFLSLLLSLYFRVYFRFSFVFSRFCFRFMWSLLSLLLSLFFRAPFAFTSHTVRQQRGAPASTPFLQNATTRKSLASCRNAYKNLQRQNCGEAGKDQAVQH